MAATRIPADILAARDYARLVPGYVDAKRLAYVAGGSGEEITLVDNARAFADWRVLPRLLRPVTDGHLGLSLLGQAMPHPFLLAPVAYQSLLHPEGELATAQGARAMQATLVLSTLSSFSLEAVANMAGPRWFQLYFQPDRSVTVDLVRRAEMAGYSALVLTLDASIKSPSPRAIRAGFVMPPEIKAANLEPYPAPRTPDLPPGPGRIFQGLMAQAPCWDDLTWLLAETSLPIVVKGVMHPQDAIRLKAMGIAAQIISNHGGRALDGAPATLDVLPSIRRAVGEGYPLLLDGGVCSGSDAFKARALGADAVLIGRLQAYALAVAGALGVAHLLRTLQEELALSMAQAGCATLADITPDLIFRKKEFAC